MIFMPIVTLLIGYALDRVIHSWLILFDRPPWQQGRSLPLTLLVLALSCYSGLGVRAYLVHDSVLVARDDFTSLQATYASRYLATLPDQDYAVLYLKSGIFYYRASPVLFFLTGKSGMNVEQPLDCSTLGQYWSTHDTVVLAPTKRIDELRALEPRVSGATHHITDDARNQPLIGVLVLPPPPPGSPLRCTTAAVSTP